MLVALIAPGLVLTLALVNRLPHPVAVVLLPALLLLVLYLVPVVVLPVLFSPVLVTVLLVVLTLTSMACLMLVV